MKKVLTTLLAIIAFAGTLFAQAPQGFNYQAVVRNAAGQLISNRPVSVRISITRGSQTGTTVYQQAQNINTNANGLFTLTVGENSTDFANIDWANGPYFLNSDIDPEGNSNYTLSTSQKILAVPYAHFAEVAARLDEGYVYEESDPRFTNWGFVYDSLRNAPTNLSQFSNDMNFLTPEDLVLSLNGDTLSITGGSYVILPVSRGGGSVEWDSIINRPVNLSDFTNDLGFITAEAQGLSDVMNINNNAYGQIKYVSTPTDPLDAVNKAYLDAELASRVAQLNARIDSLYSLLTNMTITITNLNITYGEQFDSVETRMHDYEHPDISGTLPGIFSISAEKHIRFSQGNLQYRPRIKTWRFAVNQYDVAGSDNNNVFMQAYCSSWIDLFGYGTSGWDGGASRYMPYETTTNDSEYTESNDGDDLTGFYANADWGFYNPIINGGNQMAQWRTLTYGEWNYLLNLRPNANSLKGMGTIESTPGYILLPDDWTCPNGVTFTNSNSSYNANVYTSATWAIMQAAGAVFLPAAGSRTSSTTSNTGNIGNYWSASHVNGTTGYAFHIEPNANNMTNTTHYSLGCSVRLVRDY